MTERLLEAREISGEEMRKACRERAIRLFDRQDRYKEYLALYNTLLNK